MKAISLLFLGLVLTASAQTLTTNFVTAASNFREADGQLYNIEKSKLWMEIQVKNVSVKTNGTLAMKGIPIYDSAVLSAYGRPSGYEFTKEIFIKHCPLLVEDTVIYLRVKKVKDEMVNTIESGPLLFETWDFGTPHITAVVTTNAALLSHADRIIEEAKQRAIEHYNSASEVAYRKEIDTKEHYDHLRIMALIESGSSQIEIDAMKLQQQVELEGMKNRHEMREIEWQREEDVRFKEWSKLNN